MRRTDAAVAALGIITVAVLVAGSIVGRGLYQSPWFTLLWCLWGIALAYVVMRKRLRGSTRLLHIGLLTILTGAAATRFTSREGTMILERGHSSDLWFCAGEPQHLPRAIRLDSIEPHLFNTPVVSHLSDNDRQYRLTANHPVSISGYRLRHKGIDDTALIVRVTHDPIGWPLTLAGYALVLVGGIWLALSKRAAALALTAFCVLTANAHPTEATVTLSDFSTAAPWHQYIFIACFAVSALFATAIRYKRIRLTAVICGWAVVAADVTLFAVKWLTYGIIPLGTGPDTLSALSWLMMAAVLLMHKRLRPGTAATVMLCASFAALAAWLGHRDTGTGPLPPALHSHWLAIHVSLMMVSYALLAIVSLSALSGAAYNRHHTAHSLLLPAVLLLMAGIMTGAIWAESSWGRYWGWDPKETWALITLLLYSAPLHSGLKRSLGRRGTDIYLMLCLLAVLITYFGLNRLPSLHSYR